MKFDEAIAIDAPAARAHAMRETSRRHRGARAGDLELEGLDPGDHGSVADDLLRFARRARELGGAEVGVAIRAQERAGDTAVAIAVSTPALERTDRRIVFLTGPLGRSRAALSAASFVLDVLREAGPNT